MKLISSHFKSRRLQHRLLVRSTIIYPSLREDEVNKISASNGGMYSNTKKMHRSFRFKMATSHPSGIFVPDDAVQVHVPGGRGGSCFVACEVELGGFQDI